MNKAFTLIESLITIAIFILILGGAVGLVLGLYKSHYFTFQQAQAIEEARIGIEFMVKEIREARPGDDGSYIIVNADDNEFIFFSDIDKDGDTERVKYFFVGPDFKKQVIDPVNNEYITDPQDPNYEEKIFILSKYARNTTSVFRYFDGDTQELDTPARLNETKLMRVNLMINVDPLKAPNDFILESDVQLRNLKTNL